MSAIKAFALTYVAMRLILIYAYTRAGRRVKEARPLTTRYAIGFGVAAAVWLLSAFVGEPLRFVLVGAGAGHGLRDAVSRDATCRQNCRPTTPILPERFGQLVLIVLGETVTLTIQAVNPQQLVGGRIALILRAVAVDRVRGLVGVLRRDRRPGRLGDRGWRRREGKVGVYQTWLYAHLPLVMGITIGGVGTQWVLRAPPGRLFTRQRAPAPVRLVRHRAGGLAHRPPDAHRRRSRQTKAGITRCDARLGFKFVAIFAILGMGFWGRNLPPTRLPDRGGGRECGSDRAEYRGA